jgi:sugar phosphate permease
MTGLDELFRSGRIVDLILAAVAVEFVLLMAWLSRRRRGGPRQVAALAANLLAGGFLLLAVRAALAGAQTYWIAAALAAALIAHVADLVARLAPAGRD